MIFSKFNALPYHGEVEDIGYTVLFLASDESKFITGQSIQVEGGHYIANPSSSDFNDYVTKATSN
jgi:enoyl-[acyl-carrier-protein] reductase (NADH)